MFENLEILRNLEEQRREIVNIERKLCEPLLIDTRYIRKIYEELTTNEDARETETRQIFILLVLLLYSPKKLIVGTKIGKRIMSEMCRVTKCSQPLLSMGSRNLTFYYQHYKHFKELTDLSLVKVRNMLIREGMDANVVQDYIWKFKTE